MIKFWDQAIIPVERAAQRLNKAANEGKEFHCFIGEPYVIEAPIGTYMSVIRVLYKTINLPSVDD